MQGGIQKQIEGNAEKLTRLKSYLAEGYLLHGSKNRIEVLEPRQATDDNPERKTGKAHAIYAEDGDLRIPIVRALFAEKDPVPRSWRAGYSTHGPDTPIIVTGENCTFTPGFVHVLPPDTFEVEGDEGDNERISRVPVASIDIIEVDPSILDELPGIKIDFK